MIFMFKRLFSIDCVGAFNKEKEKALVGHREDVVVVRWQLSSSR